MWDRFKKIVQCYQPLHSHTHYTLLKYFIVIDYGDVVAKNSNVLLKSAPTIELLKTSRLKAWSLQHFCNDHAFVLMFSWVLSLLQFAQHITVIFNRQPLGSNNVVHVVCRHLFNSLKGSVLFDRKCDNISVHVAGFSSVCTMSIAVNNTGHCVFWVSISCHFCYCTRTSCRPLSGVVTETVARANIGETTQASSSTSLTLGSQFVVTETSQAEEEIADCLCRNTVTVDIHFQCLFGKNYSTDECLYALHYIKNCWCTESC